MAYISTCGITRARGHWAEDVSVARTTLGLTRLLSWERVDRIHFVMECLWVTGFLLNWSFEFSSINFVLLT